MGTLFLVATPIGNLADITQRAMSTLQQVSLIAAEDTRHTGKLLAHYHIHTPLISYYEHNKLTRLEQILAALVQGDVALVSDAGTPGLNDPGFELVRAALEAGYPVSPIPGPTAPIAALVASGLPTDAFLFLGYLPRKAPERRALLEQIASQPHTLIFLETPHRLRAALRDLLAELGDRRLAVARELTKLHEEIFRGTVRAAITHFDAGEVRGEITLVIAGKERLPPWNETQMHEAVRQARTTGRAPAQLAGEISAQSGWPRRQIYRLLTQPNCIPAGEEEASLDMRISSTSSSHDPKEREE